MTRTKYFTNMNNPKIITTISEMQEISKNWKSKVGFVPTMGYLHQGHLSLVETAKKQSNVVVVSIYVNPTQFSPNEDLESYPRNFEKDLSLLSNLDVDYVFFPNNSEMYPLGYKSWVDVDEITSVLCGKSRPNHFRGVTTIVTKLINLVNPDYVFMGEKDFQQLTVLKQMLKDLNFRAKIVGCPIVRESDGLAMSSRNINLKNHEREAALSLNRSISLAKKMFSSGQINGQKIKTELTHFIEGKGGQVDYIEIVDPETLQSVDLVYPGCRIVLAVFIGKTRLIDNSIL